jgi:hypothetical protein
MTRACPKCGGPATPVIGQYVACKRCDAPKPRAVGPYLPQKKPLRTPESEVIDWVDRNATSMGWTTMEAQRDPMRMVLRVGARCSRCGEQRDMDCSVADGTDVANVTLGIRWAMTHFQCMGRP